MSVSAITPAAGNVYYGRGAIYFDRWVSGVASDQYVHLGNVDQFAITYSSTEKELYGSMSPQSTLLASVVTQSGAEIEINGYEYVPDNIALALAGTAGTLSQSTASVSDETLCEDSVQGAYLFTKYKDISSVSLKDDTVAVGSSAANYVVTAEPGMIYIPSGSSIADGSKVTASYTYATLSWDQVAFGYGDPIEGTLKFVSDPAHGPKKILEIWWVKVKPDGPVSYIADDWSTWKVRMQIQDDSENHPDDPYGREIEVVMV